MYSLLCNFSKSKLKLNHNWLYIFQNSYFTPSNRYTGYVNYINENNEYGFVCKDDSPERQYYFHVTDLHMQSIPRVRPLQAVEFGIVEKRGNNHTAINLTAVGGDPLIFNHENMKLHQKHRTLKLSQLPNGLSERHSGIVFSHHSTADGGFIIPDRLYFDSIVFRNFEIQSTGIQKLDRLSEVEFYVRAGRHESAWDKAICITRKGGGLITAERKELGCRRRLLASMYNKDDIQARVPPEYQNNREFGYVLNFDHAKNCGFILSFKNPTHSTFVHADDCHMFGPRYLNRFQFVEYVAMRDEINGKSKALQVTGYQQTILKSQSDNKYTVSADNTLEFVPDTGERILGQVIIAKPNSGWFVIKPDKANYKSLQAYKNNIKALGSRFIQLGDVLEFEVAIKQKLDADENDENDDLPLQIAVNISAVHNKPILPEYGLYGNYLRSKFNLSTVQSELEECDVSENENDWKNGYICTFNGQKKIGTIEIEAPDDVRFRKVLFHWSDCILCDLDVNKIYSPRTGNKIQCKIENVTGNEFDDENAVESENPRIFHRIAVSIVTYGCDSLQVREVQNPRFEQKSSDKSINEIGESTPLQEKEKMNQMT